MERLDAAQPAKRRDKDKRKKIKKQLRNIQQHTKVGATQAAANLSSPSPSSSAPAPSSSNEPANAAVPVDPISEADFSASVRVIHALANDSALYSLPRYRPIRTLLDPLIDSAAERLILQRARRLKRTRRDEDFLDQIDRDRRLDLEFREATELRAKRMQRLEELNKPDYVHQLAILDGPVEAAAEPPNQGPGEVKKAILCYICKKPYHELHHFYDQLCPECSALNFSRRFQTADLTGRIALVTGARVKIGYQVALKLLRANCFVVLTTRFPMDLLQRLRRELDFAVFQPRVHVYGLDFRDVQSVEKFCDFLSDSYTHFDFLIMNACQTVRRTPAFYQHLIQNEADQFNLLEATEGGEATQNNQFKDEQIRNMFKGHTAFVQRTKAESLTSGGASIPLLTQSAGSRGATVEVENEEHETTQEIEIEAKTHKVAQAAVAATATGAAAVNQSGEKKKLSRRQAMLQRERSEGALVVADAAAAAPVSELALSSQASQLVLMPGDDSTVAHPVGQLDAHGQQVDLRSVNSWSLRLHELPTVELAEVFAINSMAPTIFISRLKAALVRSPFPDRYVIAVSAMEGKFYRYKAATHPHTNMAKAALNMLVRTSAQDYVKDSIYMTAIDTGWISENNAAELAARKEAEHFQPPIDEIDAASRILSPVFEGVNEKKYYSGKFLKDYFPTEW